MDYTDDVRGIIIGDFNSPYEFWTKKPYGTCGIDMLVKIARGYFPNDDEASEWIKGKYPAEFNMGIEMRVFDQNNERN